MSQLTAIAFVKRESITVNEQPLREMIAMLIKFSFGGTSPERATDTSDGQRPSNVNTNILRESIIVKEQLSSMNEAMDK